MVLCKTKKWGSSIGIIIPRDLIRDMGIGENDEIDVSIEKKSRNTLRDLWDFGRDTKKINRKRFLDLRKEIESKYN